MRIEAIGLWALTGLKGSFSREIGQFVNRWPSPRKLCDGRSPRRFKPSCYQITGEKLFGLCDEFHREEGTSLVVTKYSGFLRRNSIAAQPISEEIFAIKKLAHVKISFKANDRLIRCSFLHSHSLDGGCGQNLQLNSNPSALTYAD